MGAKGYTTQSYDAVPYKDIAEKYREAAERYAEVVKRYEELSDYCGKIVDIMDEHITRWKDENLI